MKKIKLGILIRMPALVVVATLLIYAPALSCAADKVYFENGVKVAYGAVSVVDLRGTWREMGRQYGALLSNELRHVYETGVMTKILGGDDDKLKTAEAAAGAFYSYYPYTMREVIKGISETSGLTQRQLILVNAIEKLGGMAKCAGIAAWGSYTSGPLVYGRDYDYFPWFKALADDIVIAVYHPADGSLAAATVGYAGEIYAVNGLNEKGMFFELNNGSFSAGGTHFINRIHSAVQLFPLLFEADSMRCADLFFHTANSAGSYIIGVTDGKSARGYEWSVFGVKRSDEKENLMVITNHFTAKDWGLPETTDAKSFSSLTRRKNLLALAEKNKGKITAAVMRGILDLPLEKGGAASEITVYQMVVVPEELSMWLKIPGRQEWICVDMGIYLKK